jgi:hypothetical protein
MCYFISMNDDMNFHLVDKKVNSMLAVVSIELFEYIGIDSNYS